MKEGEKKTNKNKDTKSGKSKYAANENVAVGQERLLCLGVGSRLQFRSANSVKSNRHEGTGG